MRFYRTDPPKRYLNYAAYRAHTRKDFRRVCAYCFRHEEEAGGAAHYDQDHFKPKRLPDVDPADYLNLYWCCKECNGPQNKGTHWPTPDQLGRGEQFCDSCDHDPVGTDYVETDDGTLRVLTPAGAYTNRHLRLSQRPSLLKCREQRKSVKASYENLLRILKKGIELLQAQGTPEHYAHKHELMGKSLELVEAYERFINRDPFMVVGVPTEIPAGLIALITEA